MTNGNMPSAFDVIIIGTGAGGGTLARRLAPSGKRERDFGELRRHDGIRLGDHLLGRLGATVTAGTRPRASTG